MAIHEDVKRRTSSRTRVLMTATVISPAGTHNVLVRDISRYGAQIYADRRFSAGEDACFRRGSIFVAAQIAWCKSGVAGLRFYRELTPIERQAAFHSVVLEDDDQ